MTERETPSVDGLVIGILGGTGDQGRGLARRFALAGHQVIIGSRSAERASAAAREIGHGVQGLANADAARGASVVIAGASCLRPSALSSCTEMIFTKSATDNPPRMRAAPDVGRT